MKTHPVLQNPNTVVLVHTPLPETAAWDDFNRAAARTMAVLQIQMEGERAVIKPNITSGERFANPDTGITTHPGFVEGIVEYLKQHGAPASKITIADDPRDTDDNKPRHWQGTGYERVAEQSRVKLHCTTTYTCVKKEVPQPQVFPRLNVSRLATAPNTVLINVPKLKTHNLAITTLCMKNLMGLVNVFDRHYCLQAWAEMPEAVRREQRPRREWLTPAMHEAWQLGLARRLVDTAQVIRPALNIVEGIVGREGTGFQRGRNRPLGLAAVGTNVVAVDSLVSYLMGFDPQHLVYLRLAAEAGLGTNDVQKINVYVEQDGELRPCEDLEALRFSPPFRVISGITGEDPDPFHLSDQVIADPTNFQFSQTKFDKEIKTWGST